MAAIEIDGLSVKYKDFPAVDNISFSVEEGEIFGIIGPNGAGKTSTMECIEGLRKRSGGTIRIFGEDNNNHEKLYKNIGIQLQETNFQDNIKVSELLKLYASFYEKPADYRKYLADFELEKQSGVLVKKLSGGQKQRLSIILALIGNPRIIFLDEISTGLDPSGRRQIWALIKDLCKSGKTILLTTHFMEEAENLCDRLCLIADGKIKAIGTPDELRAAADIPITITLKVEDGRKVCAQNLPENNTFKIVAENVIELKIKNAAGIFPEIERVNLMSKVTDVSIAKPTLDDVFLKLTGYKLEGKQ